MSAQNLEPDREAAALALGKTMDAGEAAGGFEDDLRAPDDMVGKKVGPYLIERKIGEGGMGVVYEGVQESLGGRVAIKLLHGRLGSDNKTAKRFFNEARAISIVQHPGLVKIHQYEQLPDGTAYLVMEFLQGETLEGRLDRLRPRDGRLPLERVLDVGRQVASALAAAHQSGIVHCDLKPDNIFLCPDPEVAGGERVKVLDFGIAKFLSESGGKKTTAGLVLGTPRYMSPEQCEGRDKVDSKVDVYALGVILYELLGGQPPFEAATSAALMRQHMVKVPPPLGDRAPDVPEGLQHLVQDMLAKDGPARPTMIEVLARLAGGAGPPRPRPRRRVMLLGAAAALALCAAGGGWLALRKPAVAPPPPVATTPAPPAAQVAPPAAQVTPEKAPAEPPPAGAEEARGDKAAPDPATAKAAAERPAKGKRRPVKPPKKDEATGGLKTDIFGK